jgi:hypothetical protein
MKKKPVVGMLLALLTWTGCQSLPSSSLASSASSSAGPASLASSLSSTPEKTFYTLKEFQYFSKQYVYLRSVSIGSQFQEGTQVEARFQMESYLPTAAKALVNEVSYDLTVDPEGTNCYLLSFAMPSTDVSLTFLTLDPEKEDQPVYTLDVDSHVRLWGMENGRKYSNPFFYLTHDDGYLPEVTVFLTDTPTTAVSFYRVEGERDYNIQAKDPTTKQPITADITIKVTAKEVGSKAIHYEGIQDISETNSHFPAVGTIGDTVFVDVVPLSDYYFAEGTTSVSSAPLNSDADPTFYFTMPSEDVTLTISIQKRSPILMDKADHLISYSVYEGTITPGQEVNGYGPKSNLFVKFETDEGYQVTSLSCVESSAFVFLLLSKNIFQGIVTSENPTGTLELKPVVSA